jgi:hypothetical protein
MLLQTLEATQATAQQELLTHLETQAKTIAPARVDRVDVDSNYTYLSAVDEDKPEQPLTRLMVLLEDRQGNERLVDLTTNNDRFAFVARVIRNNFDRVWRIAETWETDCPF